MLPPSASGITGVRQPHLKEPFLHITYTVDM